MRCAHDEYRSVQTRYDRSRRTLVYFWRCDCCGAHLGEYERVQYRPYYETSPRLHIPGTGTSPGV
jgi:hypothetical protein